MFMRWCRHLVLIGIIILLSILVRIIIWLVPFKYYAKYLQITYQHQPKLSPCYSLGYARLISKQITKVSRYLPWQNKCLAKAIIEKILLRFWRIDNELCLGVNISESSTGADKFSAHAWLKVHEHIVIGQFLPGEFVYLHAFIDKYIVKGN